MRAGGRGRMDGMTAMRPLTVAFAAAALFAGVLAAPAAAHVTASPAEAHAPDFEIELHIDHGCAGSPTTAVRVRVPPEVADARAEPIPGWEVEAPGDSGAGPAELAWVGGPLPDGRPQGFPLRGRFTAEAGEVVYFPVVQECEQGEQRWIDVPDTLEEWDELEEPAPYVVLAFDPATTEPAPPAAATTPPVAEPGGDCGDVETTPDEGHQHLLGDAEPPVGYRSTPPASGWHYRERDRVRPGVAPPDDPLTEAEQVTVLAVGGVVIGYRELAAADLEVLEAVVEQSGERPVALTPYEALEPGGVALSAWRTVQRCDGVDRAAVEAFVDEHASEEPDFAMAEHGDDEEPPAEAAEGEQPAAPAGSGGGPGVLPSEVLIASGLLLLAAFGLAARRALRPQPGDASRQAAQPPSSSS